MPSSAAASRPHFLHGALLVAAIASFAGCSGGNAASNLAKAPEYAPKGETKCGVTKSQAEPLIVEWPDAARGKLEAQVRRGLVAVRYEGCEMEVLGQCSAKGSYGYAGLTRKRSRVTMKDADELYANIPVGAAKLESKLQKAGELNVTMLIVGRLEADRSSIRADELQGNCAGATHLITAVTIGQFDFFAGADAEVGGGATVMGVGAGARSASKREMLNEDGEESACMKSTPADKEPPAQCGALLRVEVVPLGEPRVAEPVCPVATKWDGKQCVRTEVVTRVECPAGTKLDGGQCVGNVNTACAGGLHFEAGRGCAPGVVAGAPAAASPSPAPSPALAPSPAGAMVKVPAGSFMMGSDTGEADEKPVHRVSVEAFSIDVTEVTVGAYASCVNAGRCTTTEVPNYAQCNWGQRGRGDHPMNCVDWNQSTAYCSYAGKRLPTEEEWEYAARGSDGRTYPWGNAAPASQVCWNGEGNDASNRKSTCRVGSYPAGASPFGVQDMAGNVWEWTSSAHSDDYGKSRSNAARVNRGGSWSGGDPSHLRGAYRSRGAPARRYDDLGFRCARAE